MKAFANLMCDFLHLASRFISRFITSEAHMKKALINRLNSFFDKHPSLKEIPAEEHQIKKAEKILGLDFNSEYAEFIKRFGGAYAGIDIHGFINASSMGKESVIELTQTSREILNKYKVFPEINNCLVFADDGSGNPIAIAEDNSVVLFDLDLQEKSLVAKSFDELIENSFHEWN